MYAKGTTVVVSKSKAEIERVLEKYGAKSFGHFSEKGRAIIVFEAKDRRLRFDVPLPPDLTMRGAEQLARERWRALLLCIKAKLEAVESKIETFDEAFLSHIVMPDGMTAAQHAIPRIEQAYKDNEVPALLPPPARKP